MMREVFTLPASIFCSAKHRHLGLEILEDTAIVNVMGGTAAFTDFKRTVPPPIPSHSPHPIQLMAGVLDTLFWIIWPLAHK